MNHHRSPPGVYGSVILLSHQKIVTCESETLQNIFRHLAEAKVIGTACEGGRHRSEETQPARRVLCLRGKITFHLTETTVVELTTQTEAGRQLLWVSITRPGTCTYGRPVSKHTRPLQKLQTGRDYALVSYWRSQSHQVVVWFDTKQVSEVAEGQRSVGLEAEVGVMVRRGQVAPLTARWNNQRKKKINEWSMRHIMAVRERETAECFTSPWRRHHV